MIEIPFAGAAYNLIKDLFKYATSKKKFSPEERIALAEKWRPKFEEFLYKSYKDRLRLDCIIRDVLRFEEYPDPKDSGKKISPWFKVGLLEAQHDGILVAFRWQNLIEVSTEIYRVARPNEASGEDVIRVILAGKIPYYLIESVNFDGDEYVHFPHIYCHFLNKREPYKSVEFYEQRWVEGSVEPYFVQIGEMAKIRKLSRRAGVKHL